jgi:hypothetical protein
VVFGKTNGTGISLADLNNGVGTGGFVINGRLDEHYSGRSVSGVGDINGDGLADILVGAPGGQEPGFNSEYLEGVSYIVFGKSSNTAVQLSATMAIYGVRGSDLSGTSISGAGDVNGDGLADLIVGSPQSGRTSNDPGLSHVVFGSTNFSTIRLTNLASSSRGFVIRGQCAYDNSGMSVSSAGDVNGDGLADLIIGAYNSDPSLLASAGRSYVVFGQSSFTQVELSSVALPAVLENRIPYRNQMHGFQNYASKNSDVLGFNSGYRSSINCSTITTNTFIQGYIRMSFLFVHTSIFRGCRWYYFIIIKY